VDTSRAAALRFLSAMPLNFLRNPSRVRPAAATATLLVFAISLDAFGFLLVSRVPNFTLDTLMYLHMAQYGPGSVPAPYSFRVLVPFIAAHMHVPVAIGLKIIAGISLALSLWFAGLCAIRTGASTKGAAAGILVLFCSRTVLYQFHNPYLTDAPGLMILMAMMLVSLDSHAGIFGVLGASGLLVRESMVFMVPSMLFSRQWKRGIAVCAMCAAVFLGPRFLLGSTYSRYLHSGGMIQYNLGHPLRWAALVTLSWYMAWPLLPIGLALMPRKHVAAVAGTTLTLGLGCIASCMMAGDLERMCIVLAPVMGIGAAHVFDRLFRRQQGLALATLTIWVGELFAMCQYVGHPGTHMVAALAFSLPALVLLAYAIRSLWPEARTGIKDKVAMVREGAPSLFAQA